MKEEERQRNGLKTQYVIEKINKNESVYSLHFRIVRINCSLETPGRFGAPPMLTPYLRPC